ncbi:Protein CBG26612 [Caenorhabditis briggsae]|uniref:Protein CBG26612 n=1 Tax=Caenorhabditis briggsae TaxID=6238 RepID=B6IL12_CAEBR|nr:Protein CBG26612 [Caenorhabditis briggsae]CAS00592.1 Protein CBG26612 [Caenorhabditis briggsae]
MKDMSSKKRPTSEGSEAPKPKKFINDKEPTKMDPETLKSFGSMVCGRVETGPVRFADLEPETPIVQKSQNPAKSKSDSEALDLTKSKSLIADLLKPGSTESRSPSYESDDSEFTDYGSDEESDSEILKRVEAAKEAENLKKNLKRMMEDEGKMNKKNEETQKKNSLEPRKKRRILSHDDICRMSYSLQLPLYETFWQPERDIRDDYTMVTPKNKDSPVYFNFGDTPIMYNASDLPKEIEPLKMNEKECRAQYEKDKKRYEADQKILEAQQAQLHQAAATFMAEAMKSGGLENYMRALDDNQKQFMHTVFTT